MNKHDYPSCVCFVAVQMESTLAVATSPKVGTTFIHRHRVVVHPQPQLELLTDNDRLAGHLMHLCTNQMVCTDETLVETAGGAQLPHQMVQCTTKRSIGLLLPVVGDPTAVGMPMERVSSCSEDRMTKCFRLASGVDVRATTRTVSFRATISCHVVCNSRLMHSRVHACSSLVYLVSFDNNS